MNIKTIDELLRSAHFAKIWFMSFMCLGAALVCFGIYLESLRLIALGLMGLAFSILVYIEYNTNLIRFELRGK